MMWRAAGAIFPLSVALLALGGFASSPLSTPQQLRHLNPSWTYATSSHLTFFGALAGQPLYRAEIAGTALQSDRVVFGLVSPGFKHPHFHLVCVNRRDGNAVWRRELPGDILPMSRELPIIGNIVFLALYDSTSRGVSVVAVDVRSGALLWRLDTGVVAKVYHYGDLFEVDLAKGVLHLYLPEAARDNRLAISFDGSHISRSSYRGYFWSTGARRHGGLVFGFEGYPMSGTANTAVALDENTGEVRWRIPTAGHWTSPPFVKDDVLVIAAKTELQAFDLPSGRRRWSVTLRGQVPSHPPPPVIVEDRILLAQRLHGKLPPYADWMFTSHLFSNGAEIGVVNLGERSMGPTFMRRVGPVVISEGQRWIDVVDPAIPALQSTTSYEGTFSRFVFATPRVYVDSADERGFLVSTSHGKLYYYSAPSPASAISTPR